MPCAPSAGRGREGLVSGSGTAGVRAHSPGASQPPARAWASQTSRGRALRAHPPLRPDPCPGRGAPLGLRAVRTPYPGLSPPASALQRPFGTPENHFHCPWLSRACRHRRGARSSCETQRAARDARGRPADALFKQSASRDPSPRGRGSRPPPSRPPAPRSARAVVPLGPCGFLPSDRAAFRRESEAFRMRGI